MNRLAGIILAAVGLIVAILSIVKILPGLTQVGVILILTGGFIIGLSFISKPDDEGVEKMSTGATLANIFFSPGEVFQNLRRHPRFFAALLVVSIAAVAYGNLFTQRLTPERIANYAIDKTLEISMIANNEQAKQQIEAGRAEAIANAKDPIQRVGGAITAFCGLLFWNCIAAGIYLLFALAMGGRIHFYQALSVSVYAGFAPNLLRYILSSVILYLKDPADIHPILGQQTLVTDSLNFLVTSGQNPVIYTFLSAFSVLGLYWVWLLATGLKNAGEKVSGTVAWTIAISIYALLTLMGMAVAFMFPGFIS